ncbi:MAG: 4Fe-4S binding protein [Thermodesulfobacteriota bacterium]|nr:4Fe-4S binding protein [Thermodesulfobacteriota bacterium]
MGYVVKVDKEKCDGDGACVENCPVEVFEMDANGKAEPVNAEECLGCETCIEVCETGAVTVEEE